MVRHIAMDSAPDIAALTAEILYFKDRAATPHLNVEIGKQHYNPELGLWLYNVEAAGYSTTVAVDGANDAVAAHDTIDALVVSLNAAGFIARQTPDLDFGL